MKIKLTEDQFRVLVFGKHLLFKSKSNCLNPNDKYGFYEGLLLLHDAADCIMGLICTLAKLVKHGKPQYFMIEYLVNPLKTHTRRGCG